MSGDLLRRAGAKLREAVKPDNVFVAPWATGDNQVLDGEGAVIALAHRVEADYFALMHPPVALALADLLDARAGTVGGDRGDLEAVARAILREPGDGETR